jgi:hypothetical protein
MAANPTYLTTLGVAKETVFGTPVAATFFTPVSTLTADDKLALLEDKNLRGSAVEVYNMVPGTTTGEVDFGGDVFADAIGFPLVGVLGDVTVTGATAPYSTVAAVLNTGSTQPPSYTLTATDAINARQYAGCRFSEVGLKFDGAGKLDYTAKATGFIGAVTSAPTPSFTTVPIAAGWQGVVKLGGTTVPSIQSGEITIKRSVTPIHTVAGAQAAYNNWSGPVTCDGKLTMVMETDTYRAAYAAGTSSSLDVNFTQGTGAALTQLLVHCSSIYWTAAPPKIDTSKTYIELELSFTAVANVTDKGTSNGYSPVKVTLQNAMPSGTYA